VAGDKLFVDYAGQTVPVIDAATGEIRRAQIFVAVLGASNYIFACATATQAAPDWVGSLIECLNFIGGVPRLIVPDQARALIARPDRYEPTMGRLLEEFSNHYDVAVLPARPAHPRDKPKVEVGVQVVERWILARLRNRRFFSLAELNAAIRELLTDLNRRPFKKLPGCRASAFEALERAVLKPLPAAPMVIARFKRARVNIDYHVEFEGHYYSVPHRLVRQQVDLRCAGGTLEVFAGTQRVAVHPLSARRGGHTTTAEHMPASHRAHRGALADGAPPAPRAGLPCLPGSAAPGPPVRLRAAGSRVRTGDVHPLADVPLGRFDPGRRPGPAAPARRGLTSPAAAA
jgi:transposase